MKRNRFFYAAKSLLIISLFLSASASSCASPGASADFYQALTLKADRERTSESVRLFANALSSPNKYVRQAAAEELLKLEIDGVEIPRNVSLRSRREVSGFWAEALDIVNNSPSREKALRFLFKYRQGDLDYANRFLTREYGKKGIFFSAGETAAIEGHLYISNSRYNEALSSFRVFQENGYWPREIPEIFLSHPALINDLGRAFLYTSSNLEGLSLFSGWETDLNRYALESIDDIRFRLIYYGAWIARRAGLREQAISAYEKALPLAPDTEQKDASIWYILDMSLDDASDSFIDKLERYIPLWRNGDYFNDVLERFLSALVSKRDWNRVSLTFNLIKDAGASIKAAYAWVLSRATEEGFIAGENAMSALDYARVAYDAASNNVSSLLYYRSLCAGSLGEPFLSIAVDTDVKTAKPSQALEFLLGFFDNNAALYADAYIARVESELSAYEARAAALAFQNAGSYAESIRLASRLSGMEAYALTRRDMELLFPRAYTELVEKYASQTGVEPWTLFALIRTESFFQSDVVSSAGAGGLTQLMPETALEMAGRIRRAGGPDYAASFNTADPEQNIHIGAYYLSYLMERFEDSLLSLMAYNGGMNRARRWRSSSSLPVDLLLETIPFYETRDYGRKVTAAAAVYKYLYYSE